MSDLDYSQQRSLNVGIAMDTGSIGAAAIYDDLVYAQKVFGPGFFFRSYEQMMKRFPFWSERTIRNYIKTLENKGWLRTKIMKVNGKPVCHYQICRFLSAKIADTKEMVNFAETINIETKKETKTSRKELESSLLSLVNEITGRGFRTLPERGVKKTLDAFTLEEISSALRALVRDPWHRDKLKEFKIDYLIRATTIDKFLGVAPKNGEPLAPARDEEGSLIMTQEEKNERLRKEAEERKAKERENGSK